MESGLPGVEIDNGLCRMFLNYARPSQLPYNEKSKNDRTTTFSYINSPHSYPRIGGSTVYPPAPSGPRGCEAQGFLSCSIKFMFDSLLSWLLVDPVYIVAL